MGSTIICKVKAYIAVGGARKSAKNFMQSLAKFSEINFLNKNLVYPSPRLETRVHLELDLECYNIIKMTNL